MSSLEAPAKEELLQELLAFKHLEVAPECIDDIAFRVRLLNLDSEYHKNYYSKVRQTNLMHIDAICAAH